MITISSLTSKTEMFKEIVKSQIVELHCSDLTRLIVLFLLFQNQISSISPSLAQCPRLKTLKVEENCLSLDAIPTVLLTNSSVSTLNLNGNLFSEKQFADCEGYDKYLERYTAVRRKMD